jgi:hypothetical protein
MWTIVKKFQNLKYTQLNDSLQKNTVKTPAIFAQRRKEFLQIFATNLAGIRT